MFSLEDKLRPPKVENPWPRDTLGLVLLIAIAAMLYPHWLISDDLGRFLTDVAGQMAGFYLLPAMGFCLALRCGAVDLSVWASASLGGLTAAWLINAGAPPGWAFACACAAGLAVGAFNAALVAFARIPSPLVTLAAALVIIWATQAAAPGRAVAVSPEAFGRWHLGEGGARQGAGAVEATDAVELDVRETWRPILLTRMLIVAAGYGLVMAAMFAADSAARAGIRFGARTPLFAALCISGLLCGAAGPCWLMEHASTPVPTRPIGDLRVVAAAVLAGGWFFAGRGRALLAGLCLPVAMLLATIWRQEVRAWDLDFQGYTTQLLQLAVMVIGVHLAMAHLLSKSYRYVWPAAGAVALAVAGVLTTAGIARADSFTAAAGLYATGVALWAGGMAALGISAALARRRRAKSFGEG